MTERAKANRIQAYRYMVQEAEELNWIPPIDSDKRLADVLDLPLADIHTLRMGLSHPSAKMVAAFKKLVGQRVTEAEIDSYLVTPFEHIGTD